MTTATAPVEARVRWTPGRKRAFKIVFYVAVVALAVFLVSGDESQLQESFDELTDVEPGWVVVASVVEVAAYVAAGLGLRVLLPRPSRPSVVGVTRISLAGQAAANVLPGGPATAAVVMVRQLARRAVQERTALGAVLTLTLLQAVALPVLALVGAQAPGAENAIPGVQTLAGVFIGVSALLLGVGVVLHRRGVLLRVLEWLRDRLPRWVVDAVAKMLPAPAEDGSVPAAGPRTPRTLALAFGLALAYWLLDALCFGLAFPAVGAVVPWRGLLLSYCAGQLATTLPITPGGLGVVEGSLTLALVSFGDADERVLAAVLLYRLISYPGVVVVGGLASLRRRRT